MNMQYSKTSKIKSGIFHVLNMKEGKKMKKSFLLLVSMVLLILLAGCNTAGPEQTQPAAQPTESTVQETLPQILPITCEPAEPVEYSAVMAALTQKRQDQLAIAGDWHYTYIDHFLTTCQPIQHLFLIRPGYSHLLHHL